MKPDRQLYLLKLWHDEEGQLRIELRPSEASQPHYFGELSDLKRFLEQALKPPPEVNHAKKP
jgi:hypothetical protein